MVIQSNTSRLGAGKNFKGRCNADGSIYLLSTNHENKLILKKLQKSDGKYSLSETKAIAGKGVGVPISSSQAFVVQGTSGIGIIEF